MPPVISDFDLSLLSLLDQQELASCLNRISPSTRMRGLSLYEKGQVTSLMADDRLTVKAEVQDERPFAVVLKRDHARKLLYGECSCRAGKECQHIAALCSCIQDITVKGRKGTSAPPRQTPGPRNAQKAIPVLDLSFLENSDGTFNLRISPGSRLIKVPYSDGKPLLDKSASEKVRLILEQAGFQRDLKGVYSGIVKESEKASLKALVSRLPAEAIVKKDAGLKSFLSDPRDLVPLLSFSDSTSGFLNPFITLKAERTLSIQESQRILEAGEQGTWIRDLGWCRTDQKALKLLENSLFSCGISLADMTGETPAIHAAQLAGLDTALYLKPLTETANLRRSRLGLKTDFPFPSAFNGKLRDYQINGYKFLRFIVDNGLGGLLADEMGLGKTVQVLSCILGLVQQVPSSKPVLIVCPKSVLDNWFKEAARFAPSLSVEVVSPRKKEPLSSLVRPGAVILASYASLRLRSKEFFAHEWSLVVLDEAQHIKNPDTSISRAVTALKASARLALTGTPVENRILDLWSIFRFAMPALFGDRSEFAQNPDKEKLALFRNRMRPFTLRRLKSEVAADLPDRIELVKYCQMHGLQRAIYQKELEKARTLIAGIRSEAELSASRFSILTTILRLRQICAHPKLVNTDEPCAGSVKLEALAEITKAARERGEKVLIFSQFTGALGLIRERLMTTGTTLFYLDGSTEKRGELVESFSGTTGPACFLISLKAGGFGLNLTAARHVVLYDLWWNPAVEAQAIDRTHRIGQTEPVIAHRLVIKDTIEERILDLQERKALLASDILSPGSAESLSLEDFKFLIEKF